MELKKDKIRWKFKYTIRKKNPQRERKENEGTSVASLRNLKHERKFAIISKEWSERNIYSVSLPSDSSALFSHVILSFSSLCRFQ
jgi:hypothetical protein